MRTDRYERFVSCLVFLPRDRFNTANRTKIGELLREAFGAESVDWGLRLTEWVLVRIHYTLHVQPGELRDFDVAALEAQIVEATRSWDDELQAALLEEGGEESGSALHRRYANAFPPAYRDDLLARSALADIQRIEAHAGRRRRSTSASTGRWRARRACCAASSTGATAACCSPTSCRCSRASG